MLSKTTTTSIVPILKASPSLLVLLALLVQSCRPEVARYESVKTATYSQAAVATAHPLASDVGLDVLKQGGNAVDAAIAVQFALAVVYPRAGNIGGGGFLLYRAADGSADALDYREKAPLAATRDMYLDADGNPIDGLSVRGHKAAGVPGTVAGLAAAHQRYGSLPWAQLVQPAIDLAEQGFRLSTTEAERLNSFQDDFIALNEPTCPFIRPDWVADEVVRQPDLAATLTRIRDAGHDGFYAGQTAQLLVAEMQRGGGLITAEDLTNYQPRWRTPLRGTYRNYTIVSMPPPSSGGVALLQMLGMVEGFPLRQYGYHSPEAIHLMAEAERRAYADRAAYLGDADHYPVPVDSLIDKTYITSRMADFDAAKAGVSTDIGEGNFSVLRESFETTHTSIVDAQGNAVSLTTTLNSNFGCKVMVDRAGFFLNNEMDDFSIKPGTPNQFGLVGTEANAIAPHKRMLSSMTPTIVEKDGQLFMVLGAPGGSTIITAVFQVFLNVVEFDLPLDSAVAAPRFHHQWLPDQIWLEDGGFDAATQAALQAKGHQFKPVDRMAVIKAIQRLPNGQYTAASDARNPDDDVSGY